MHEVMVVMGRQRGLTMQHCLQHRICCHLLLLRVRCAALQVDGCGDANYYPTGYPKMGAALAASGRNISYSCSWPAYLGDDETTKPWSQIIDSGCLVSGGHGSRRSSTRGAW